MTQAYDIIPDIHADIDRLTQTLSTLGYVQEGDTWAHQEGRMAAFLGDFIDMGRANRSFLTLARAMCDRGHEV